MRKVIITITHIKTGKAHLTSYPYRPKRVKYSVPLYRVTVNGKNGTGTTIAKNFDAICFGAHRTKTIGARMVGLAKKQSHRLTWDNITTMLGNAWRVYAGFFIRQGPGNPLGGNFDSIGCVEITGHGK